PQVGISRPGCSFPASSPGPALPLSCLYRPNSCLTVTSLDSATAQLAAFVGPKRPQAKFSRPISYCTVGLSGQAPTLRRHLQAQLLSPNGLHRPRVFLPVASAGPSCPQIGLSRASSCLPVSSADPNRPQLG
ncbi:hypothetical protein EGM_19794, partial [Macaca fascicularis]